MQFITKFVAAVVAGVACTTGVAMAIPNAVPEPTSLALGALGVAGVLFFARKGKK